MNLLAAVILEHTDENGVHYDLLIEDPSSDNPHAQDAPLWTARIHQPPGDWLGLQTVEIEPINRHRRAYFNYEGPLSRNRGNVRRLKSGSALAELWESHHKRLHLDMPGLLQTLDMQRVAEGNWCATITKGKKLSPEP